MHPLILVFKRYQCMHVWMCMMCIQKNHSVWIIYSTYAHVITHETAPVLTTNY